ncbi:UNVERIFIED_CONTAM: protein NRT1/ PTR FAMILY 2.13 [Sesamum calycinum]|uniref:Protein NRT1/ PTR FAMILY 2.13 n=1 Tax=Sesamum calycinum TaxID=2727403 RepID=A0AAW2PR10_9LAMI
MESSEEKEMRSSSWLLWCSNKFPTKSPPSPPPENGCDDTKAAAQKQRKPGGWKAMPYVLGNETLERLAAIGLLGNFMVYLLREFHMGQVEASNVLNIWSGLTNFSPLIGAFISDSFLGRFTTIAYATIASFMGMLTMTLIAWLPQLHPPPCNVDANQCRGPTKSQFGILVMALGFLSIGSGGIRPCSIPFGVDQFDATTEEGQRGINSFFNCAHVVLDPAVLRRDEIVCVCEAGGQCLLRHRAGGRCCLQERKATFPDGDDVEGVYYDPPPVKGTIVKKLALTNQFRFLNKAALITEGEVLADGSKSKPWGLCSIQQVEETKCLFRIMPVWVSGIICFTAMSQQGTFTVSQASKMDRSLGRNFKIPPGSLSVISMITIGIWLPFYDRVLVPPRKVTRLEGGISLLQRMGIGIVFSILSMIIAGLVERVRRASAVMHAGQDGIAPLTVFWLAPQLMVMGFAEAFNIIGQIEFYNKEFPENMRSVANSLFLALWPGLVTLAPCW